MTAVSHLAELRWVPAARLRYDSAQGGGYYLVSLGPAGDLLMRPRDDPAPPSVMLRYGQQRARRRC